MNDIDRTALLEKIAGKNRANQIGALLNNFSQAEKALKVSKESAGSAAKENAAYIDSIQGRINQLKAAFEDLSIDFFNSEDIKIVIQGLTKIIELVDKLVEFTGSGPLLAFGLTSFMGIRGGVEWDKLPGTIAEITKSFSSFFGKGVNQLGKGLKNTGLNITEFVVKTTMDLKEKGEDVSDIFDMLYEDTNKPLFKNISKELREFEHGTNQAGEATNTLGDQITEDLGKTATEAAESTTDAVESVGEGAKKASKGVKSLGAGFKALLVQLAISAVVWGVTQIIESIETVEKLKDKVDEAAENYKNITNELENVTSQLEDNKELIEEINANPLTITSKEDLDRLREENALLETQKQILEFEEKSKATELSKAATEFLNKKGYSYSQEKGIKENWFGDDSYLKAAEKAANDYSTNIDKFKDIDYTKDVEKNIEMYSSLANTIQAQEENLTEVINKLSEQRQYLNENSEAYKDISKILSTITDKQKEFYNFTSNSSIIKTIAAYAEQDATFIEQLNKYNKAKEYTYHGGGGHIHWGQINFNKVKELGIDSVLNKYGFEINDIDSYKTNGRFSITGSSQSYSYITILDALNNITKIKKNNLELDKEELAVIDSVILTLKEMAGIADVDTDKIYDIENLTLQQQKIESFFASKKETWTDINASNFFNFKKELYDYYSRDEDFDKDFMDEYLASIFPSYQDINSWLEAYANEGNFDIVNELTEKILSGEDIDWSDKDYNIIKNAFLAMFNAENIDDIEDNADYFINNLNNRLNKKLSKNKAKSQEIDLNFNQKKSDFDENANSTLSMFESAINSAQSAFSNQATVTYEDMWTMIQTDESLVDSFTKTANGYTVSVDALREAKERYIKTVKNGFEEDRQDALALIKDAEANKAEAENVLYTIDGNGEKVANPNTSDKAKSDARKNIQEANEIIAEQEVVLAKVDLQLEEINGQTVDYANTLDEITSKLSSWESIYQSIINDMSKINKLSSSTLQAIMKAAPNNWQDMVYLDDNNQIQADQQKLFEFANQDLIKNINTQKENLSKAFSEQVNSTFKSKYNLDLGVDFELTGDYEQDLKNLEQNIKRNLEKADIGQLSSIKGGINVNETLEELTPNLDEASEGIKIFIALLEALFGEFEENKALADFNSDIEKIQHSLSMGSINQILMLKLKYLKNKMMKLQKLMTNRLI